MTKLSKFEFKDLLDKLDIFKKNIGLIFWVLLAVLLAFEFFTIKNSIYQIIDSYKEPTVTNKDRGVRINFEGYDKVVNRINAGKDFIIEERVINNPFGGK